VANHPSARKRARQNKKRRAANVQLRSSVKTAVKNARVSLSDPKTDAVTAVRRAESALSRAASKGVIPKGRVSRKVSRLMKAAHRRQAAAKG
jgi:small subunit ribosomal protein S20